jgi:hypothetical protein
MPENRSMHNMETIWVHRVNMADSAPEDEQPPSWLQNAKLIQRWQSPPESLSTALEVALCDLAHEELTDGLFPWAAHHAAQAGLQGTHWGQLHLSHWHVSNGQVSLLPPEWPSSEVLQTLWQELAEFVSSDGLKIYPANHGLAWVTGDLLENTPTASIDKVMGRPLSDYLPRSSALKRLQNELQMWFYTHPRLQSFRQPINSVWFSGTGRLPSRLDQLLSKVIWAENGLAPAGVQMLWANDVEATLWLLDGASLGQRLWRRWRPQAWKDGSHEVG